MTQEEILEYNKMCAEFLGWTIDQDEILTVPEECKVKPQIYWPAYKNLLFHSDWNWIMEVVEAIEKLKFNVRITIACIKIENAFDNDSNLSPIYKFHSIQGEFESKKEAVVQAINQFLIWYNEQRT